MYMLSRKQTAAESLSAGTGGDAIGVVSGKVHLAVHTQRTGDTEAPGKVAKSPLILFQFV